MPSLVHADQLGFLQGREARDNIIRTLSLISRVKTKRVVSLVYGRNRLTSDLMLPPPPSKSNGSVM